jgi:predicted metal-dependent HD superfamily phosphohydrolase
MTSVFACRHAPLVLPPEVEHALDLAYAEPQRAYHTGTHIHDVLHWFDEVCDQVGWRSPEDVYLAVVFHDAVYDPTRHDNEARSAELAQRLMNASAETVRLILLTAEHGKLDPAGIDHDAAHFLDSDTAILGASAAVFDDYDAAVRVEYQHVPDDAYRTGRGAFLKSMLSRERIFFADFFHAQLDRRARDNLARALARLS